MEKFKIEEKIVAMLKTVYDPEIPVNVYDLGLIYKIDVSRCASWFPCHRTWTYTGTALGELPRQYQA